MIAYISFEYALSVHDQLIREYGGASGLLNEGLLRSALEMPKASYAGKDLHLSLYDKTAAYLFHIIQNHPFLDGNKRTASMIAMVFFASNFDGSFTILNQDYQDLILGVAQGKTSKKEIAKFFRSASKKR